MAPTVYDKQKAIKTLKRLCKRGFKSAIQNSHKFYIWAQAHGYKCKGLCFTNGATRVVIIDDKSDWVIKIDISEDYSYCKIEETIYKDACLHMLDNCFAAIYYGGCVGGIDFYLQEKAIANQDDIHQFRCNYVLKNEDIDWDWYVRDNDETDEAFRERVVYDIVDDMDDDERIEALIGGKVGELLYNFLDNEICDLVDDEEEYGFAMDLHDGNWGTIGGEIKLIDYSGYRS